MVSRRERLIAYRHREEVEKLKKRVKYATRKSSCAEEVTAAINAKKNNNNYGKSLKDLEDCIENKAKNL